jgi:N utilization substance protein B
MTDFKKRHRAREIALQVLFQKEFVPDLNLKNSIEYFRTITEAPAEAWSYATELLEGVEKFHKEIDSLISSKSINWKISRMAPVDLSAMRIAIFEMKYAQGVPPKVAIDEAIELVKDYSGTDSSQFINGLLNEVFKSENL